MGVGVGGQSWWMVRRGREWVWRVELALWTGLAVRALRALNIPLE